MDGSIMTSKGAKCSVAEAGAHPDPEELKLQSVTGTLSPSMGQAILQRIPFYISPSM